MPANTLPEILQPLMHGPSIKLRRCAICGRVEPLNQHHIVRRGAGELYWHGKAMPKPTITLCGFGNNLQDSDGRYYCHGLAHANQLHFRFVENTCTEEGNLLPTMGTGHWEYIKLKEPTSYENALKLKGWKRINTHE